MSQRLLEANQRKVAAAAALADRILLLQDRAVLLARLGRVAEAELTLADAEQQMPADAPAALRLRFAYVRAIDAYFAKRFADAQHKMHDALKEARLSNDRKLVSECESALALFMQREGDVRTALALARSVLANSEATLEARYRASLAMASLHQDAHDHENAYRLYRETHAVVKDLNDEIAMASSLQRAALAKAAFARQAAGSGELDKRSLDEAIEAINQGIDYAKQVPDGPETTLDYLLLAEMHVLQKRYKLALDLYDFHLPQCEGEGFLHEVTAAMADRAHCLLQLGRVDDGYAEAVASLRRLDGAAPADIRAIVHENMAAALDSVHQSSQAVQHRTMAQAAWATHRHEQREARRLLHETTIPTLH